jgi:hypothetical protein
MGRSFNTLTELRAEISILQLRKAEQETDIHEKFKSPLAILKTMGSLFKVDSGNLISHDMITNVSRVIIPMILNSSIFKGSGFITKALVTLFSQKAAKKVNMDVITSLIDKVKDMFKKEGTSRRRVKDYGIPPDSETY